MLTIQKLLSEIDEKILEIKNHRPLSKGELQELQKSLGIMFTHNSNAIEGNSITLGETKLILEDGLTIGGKTIRELNEVINHKQLLNMLYDFLSGNKEVSIEFIKEIHSQVLKNIDDENAGTFRNIQVYITGEEKLPTDSKNIEKEMSLLIQKYIELKKQNIHPALIASEFHYDFVKIHPFIDGNGRTVRLLINMILMKYGYPMIIIPNVRRFDYISSLNSTSKKENFIIFMLDVINQNLEDYLRMIK